MKSIFPNLIVAILCISFLMRCSSAPRENRHPASSVAAFNWSTIEDSFQGDAWELVSPTQAAKYSDFYFLSDVHGRLIAFVNLLYQAKLVDSNKIDVNNNAEGNWIGKSTLMVLAGDYIDGGDDSAEVLKWLKSLQKQASSKGSRLIILSGNHEGEMLAKPEAKNLAKETFNSFASPSDIPEAESFVKTFKIGAVVGSWFIAHSGYIVPSSGSVKDLLTAMSKAWESGQYDDLTDADGKGVAGVLERHDWWEKHHSDQHDVLSSLGLNGFIAGHEPGLFGSDKDKILISNEGWAVKIDAGLKDEKKDGTGIGEMLHCAYSDIKNGSAGFKTLDQCERIKADGSSKSLKN